MLVRATDSQRFAAPRWLVVAFRRLTIELNARTKRPTNRPTDGAFERQTVVPFFCCAQQQSCYTFNIRVKSTFTLLFVCSAETKSFVRTRLFVFATQCLGFIEKQRSARGCKRLNLQARARSHLQPTDLSPNRTPS